MPRSIWDEVEVAGGGLKGAGFSMINSREDNKGYGGRDTRFMSTVCK